MIDTPLSGTGTQAKVKDLVVLGSGDREAYDAMVPVMEGFSRAQYYLGVFGNGMKMKFVANQQVAIHNIAAAEAVLFGTRMGLDPQQVVDVIGNSAGSSRMFQMRAPMMVRRTWDTEATATNTVMKKDLKLIEEAIQNSQTPSPMFSLTIPLYTAAIASGHAEDDTAAVYEVLERMTKAPN